MALEITAKWLWNQYWEEDLTFEAIASAAGVSIGTIQNRMNLFNFPRRRRGRRAGDVSGSGAFLTIKDILEIKTLYEIGDSTGKWSQSELALAFKVSKQRIHQIVNGEHRHIR